MTTSAQDEAPALGARRISVEPRVGILPKRSWRQRLRLPLMLLGPVVVLLGGAYWYLDDRTLRFDRRRLCASRQGFDQHGCVWSGRQDLRSRQSAGEGRRGSVQPRSAAVYDRGRGSQGATRRGQAAGRGDESDIPAETCRGCRQRRRRSLMKRASSSGKNSCSHRAPPPNSNLTGQAKRFKPTVRNSCRNSRTSPIRSPASAAILTFRCVSTRWSSTRRRHSIGPSSTFHTQPYTRPKTASSTKVEQLQVGEYVNASHPTVLAVVFRPDLGRGQFQRNRTDAYAARAVGHSRGRYLSRCRSSRRRVESLSPGTGLTFSLLPAENATGNWVKVVQRLPGPAFDRKIGSESSASRRAQRHGRGRYPISPTMARPGQ